MALLPEAVGDRRFAGRDAAVGAVGDLVLDLPEANGLTGGGGRTIGFAGAGVIPVDDLVPFSTGRRGLAAALHSLDGFRAGAALRPHNLYGSHTIERIRAEFV